MTPLPFGGGRATSSPSPPSPSEPSTTGSDSGAGAGFEGAAGGGSAVSPSSSGSGATGCASALREERRRHETHPIAVHRVRAPMRNVLMVGFGARTLPFEFEARTRELRVD